MCGFLGGMQSIRTVMGGLTSVVLVLLAIPVFAEPTDLELLQRELAIAAPPRHYPDGAEYTLFPELCTDLLCFKIVAVRTDRLGEKVIRLAIFSQDNHYIGSYSALKVMPVEVRGTRIRFPMSIQTNWIEFHRTGPPNKIRLGDTTHTFERAR